MPGSTLGLFHLALALLALGAGVVIVFTAKGGRVHRRAGWVYAAAMIGVNVTALAIYRLFGSFGPFHWAATFSLATIAAGVVPVRRKAHRRWVRQHAYWMSGSYVGLWAAAVAEVSSRTDLLPFWWTVLGATLIVMAVGGVAIGRGVPRAIARLTPSRSASDRPRVIPRPG